MENKAEPSYLDIFQPDKVSGREHLLGKLRQVFRDGYRPARGAESYNTLLKNGLWAYEQVNCLGHVFNLRNQQFNDYQIKPYVMYGHFPRRQCSSNRAWAGEMLDFIKETGLRVNECDPMEPITDFRSWKMALYFSPNDFHYLLEDAPQHWSSKCGVANYFEQIDRRKAPHKYRYCNLPGPEFDTYHLYNTYKITNPHADENNRYVKDRVR